MRRSFSSIPNFNDKYAKVRERMHEASGARIVEVLYGARDRSGRPTEPLSSEDGHGHVIALEIDGLYQVLYWRHPRSEGGGEEYGRKRSANIIHDLEKDIARKESLCAEAETLSKSSDWKATSQRLRQLQEDWKKIFNWDTPKERELWKRFKKAQDTFFERRNADREKNKRAKQALISQAESLSTSTEWKSTGKRLRELMDQWKKIGHAGKDADGALWERFNGARQAFYRRRDAHFDKLEQQWSTNRQIKQEIVSEARRIAGSRNYSRQNTESMKELDRRWKETGHAGKEHEDTLWREFNSAKDIFWSGKREDAERRDREWHRRMEDVISRKQSQISNLWSQISHLESKRAGLRNQEYISNINGWIDDKRDTIRELERDIQDIRSKL